MRVERFILVQTDYLFSQQTKAETEVACALCSLEAMCVVLLFENTGTMSITLRVLTSSIN